MRPERGTANDGSPAPAGLVMMTVSLEGERFQVLGTRADAAAFWRKADAGRWEGDTFRFIRQHVGRDTVFIDIGAWIGPISLYASRFAHSVLALEPDPVAHGELVQNVGANAQNVDVWHAGIDAHAGELILYAPRNGLGQSTTSSFRSDGTEAITVKTVTFDRIEARLQANSPADSKVAVKVDIEGHEYHIIDAIVDFARRHDAPLHLSLHPRSFCDDLGRTTNALSARLQTWRATRDIVRKLTSLGPVTFSTRSAPFAWSRLAKLVLLHRYIKNFSVEVATSKTNPD